VFFYAGVVAGLRLLFALPLLWAQALAVAIVPPWRYWAHASGLWPWRFSAHASYYAFPSLPQAVLNAVPWFVGFLVLGAAQDGKVTRLNLLTALGAGVLMAFLNIEPRHSPPRSIE
jgi:hypothetical protein